METFAFYLVAALGVACHVLKTLVHLRRSGELHIGLGTYLRDHPYQTMLSVGMAVSGVVLLEDLGQLTMAAAWLAGYSSDSVTDLFGGRVAKVYQ